MKEEKTILFQDNFIHNSIKDAFLQLLMKKDYMQITITDLCKYAGVSRGTFYAHFGNIGQVVDELFSDALCDIKNMASSSGPVRILKPVPCPLRQIRPYPRRFPARRPACPLSCRRCRAILD